MTIASAPSKLNLALRVGAQKPDGYHALASIFYALSPREYVVARRSRRAMGANPVVRTVVYDTDGLGSWVPSERLTKQFAKEDPATNLAMLAAKALGAGSSVSLTVHKTVPVAGGMAGGSADAAATLMAVNQMLGLRLPFDELLKVGARLGADVPASLMGGISYGTGRGDVLEPIFDGTRNVEPRSQWWVLVFFDQGLSTAKVFSRFDDITPGSLTTPEVSNEQRQALATPSIPAVLATLDNQLQDAAFSLRPELAEVGEGLQDLGAQGWVMSGAGPTVAALAKDEASARELAAKFDELKLPGVRSTAVVWGPTCGASLERALPSWAQAFVGADA